jgi:hypothetical protein
MQSHRQVQEMVFAPLPAPPRLARIVEASRKKALMSRCKISRQRSAITTVSAVLLAIMALVAGTARAQGAAGSPGATVGEGTELIYENCYEHVGAFRVPLDRIRDLVGSELPPGFAYRTFDPEGTIGQINGVAIDCEQGGHGVTDVFLNALVLNEGQPTALRVRMYTNSPQSNARYALFCLGNVTTRGEVQASVDVDPTGVRHGRVFGTDGVGSIRLMTTTSPLSDLIGAVTLQHFTVKDGELHGRFEWGSLNTGRRQLGSTSTLVVDGATYAGIISQHVYPEAEGAPHTFFHRGLTSCPPGLD